MAPVSRGGHLAARNLIETTRVRWWPCAALSRARHAGRIRRSCAAAHDAGAAQKAGAKVCANLHAGPVVFDR